MLPTAVIMDDSPEARLLKLVKDLATKVEELKDKHGKTEHAKKILVANGLPDYFELLSNTVIEGRAPSTHLFIRRYTPPVMGK